MRQEEDVCPGRAGRRKTGKKVFFADALAGIVITGGGIGTILAVLGVCVFLVWVAFPLFEPAWVGPPRKENPPWRGTAPCRVEVDEHLTMGWALLPGGTFSSFDLATGAELSRKALLPGKVMTSWAQAPDHVLGAAGFRDGSVCLFRARFVTAFPKASSLPAGLRAKLRSGRGRRAFPYRGGMLQLTPKDQFRLQTFHVEILKTENVTKAPVLLLALALRPQGPMIAAYSRGGKRRLLTTTVSEKEDFMTGETTLAFDRPVEFPLEGLPPGDPAFLALSGQGRDLFLAWKDGFLARFRLEPGKPPFLAERGRLFPPGRALTALGFILGGTTLAWGDSEGNVKAGFLVPFEKTWKGGLLGGRRDPRARFALAAAKDLGRGGAAVTCLAPSPRSRLLAAGFGDGSFRVVNVTSTRILASARLPSGKAVRILAVAPKENGLFLGTKEKAWFSSFDPKYPEADLRSLFLPVWYEGYPGPIHMWQTSSATDDSEPKFSLVPLIFGTLKATFYALLFGAPLALLAALYTSEFLGRRTRSLVKPVIELMASLPSVVLGFLAALVFAPFVEKRVVSVLALFFLLPFFPAAGAHLWRLLPPAGARRLAPFRLLFIALACAAGIFLAFTLGPVLERSLFGGSFTDWLSWTPGVPGKFGNPLGGIFFLALPPAILVAFAGGGLFLLPLVRASLEKKGRKALALGEAAGFLFQAVLALLLALGLAALLSSAGLDPRAEWNFLSMNVSPMGVYVQRNALIVGFVMGFAVIPIIYSISEDALAAVPDHLRSASLAAGATPWQTAVRIVVPTAMSGLFSALMIGLGRAVGETMIVLMALGNTPIMDWNLFNGARTLSATIAVELPEAVRGSTHYRVLFMAALVLFVMTFLVNTLAELVRLRFRKKAVQL